MKTHHQGRSVVTDWRSGCFLLIWTSGTFRWICVLVNISIMIIVGGKIRRLDIRPTKTVRKLILNGPICSAELDPVVPAWNHIAFVTIMRNKAAVQQHTRWTLVKRLLFGRLNMENQMFASNMKRFECCLNRVDIPLMFSL